MDKGRRKFETRMRESKGSVLARKYWEKLNRRELKEKELSKWKEKRREYLRKRDLRLDSVNWKIEEVILKEKNVSK